MSQQASKEPSEEVDERQLELAAEEGDAYLASIEYMANEVAHTGGTTEADDFTVAFAQEEAEGMYHLQEEGDLEWVEPDDENCHIEVAVADIDDGRFVPELDVEATLVPEDGDEDEVGPFEVPYVWHPGLHHYGVNVTIPEGGTYTVRVHVEPPTFDRHDETNGDRYADAVDVAFEDVDIEAGQD